MTLYLLFACLFVQHLYEHVIHVIRFVSFSNYSAYSLAIAGFPFWLVHEGIGIRKLNMILLSIYEPIYGSLEFEQNMWIP